MQKNLQKLSKLKNWIKENNVTDVFIFGSFTRGNENPKDIDVCILINEFYERDALKFVSSLSEFLNKENINSHVNIITEKEFIEGNSLTKTLIEEGISILKGKALSEILGYEKKSYFFYSLKSFTASKRVSFHYALNGRYGRKGFLSENKGEIISSGVIATLVQYEGNFNQFFNQWGVDFNTKRMLG